MTKRLLVIPALLGLVFATACSAKSESMSAAYPEEMEVAHGGGAPGYYEGDADMMADDDYRADGVAVAEAPPAPESSRGMFGGKMKKKSGGAPARQTVSSPEPKPAPVAADGEPEPAIGDPEPPDDHGRQIIYTASMEIGVYNVSEAMNVVEALPERFGGWIHSRTEGHLTIKLPAQNLRPAMDELGKLGNVVARNLQAQDVTAEFYDLETRIRVLRETQTQLIELLKKAKSVEEALHVRQALDDVTMQLETSLGRMRQLQSSISFSTLTVNLMEQGPYTGTPSSNDPFPWVDSLGVEATEWR